MKENMSKEVTAEAAAGREKTSVNARKVSHYITPILLAMLIFSSNFLDTEIFQFGALGFAVWFAISLFCFACGWLINKTLGWRSGGKAMFALTVASTLLSVAFVSFFREYFGTSPLLAENFILFSLRNVTLGCMGFFGMTVAELLYVQREILTQSFKIEAYEKVLDNAKKEAEVHLKEAHLKAETMVRDAEIKVRKLSERKERLERELRTFIQTEKELIKKYEQ